MQPFGSLSHLERAQLPRDGVCEDAYPLTTVQAQVLATSSPGQDITVQRVDSLWDRQCFAGALNECVQQHPILRSRFHLRGDRPLQCVYQSIPLALEVQDLRELSESDQKQRLQRLTQRYEALVRDWEQIAPVEVHILLCARNSFELVLISHRAMLDGRSREALSAQLCERYERLLQREATQPSAVAWALRDAVEREQKALADEDARAYIAQMLDEAPIQQLPRLKRADPEQEAFVQQTVSLEGFAQAWPRLVELAERLRVPLQAVLLAGHLKALCTLSGESRATSCRVSNVCIDSMSGEQPLGSFWNCLPLSVQLGNGSWAELIRDLAALWGRSSLYSSYPLLKVQQDLGRPFCEVLFNYTEPPICEATMAACSQDLRALTSLGDRNLGLQPTGFTLLITVARELISGRASFRLIYNTQALSEDLIGRLGEYHLTAYEWMLQDPGRQHRECSLLSTQERQQLLEGFNATTVDYGPQKLLHEVFEEQVRRTPHLPAVIFEGQRLSYRELNERANQLAHHLRASGVGPDRLVGVCLERSLEMVVGLLATLKAGGAYVPLDPGLPEERLQYLIQDTDPELVLTQKHLESVIPRECRRVFALDSQWDGLSGYPCCDISASSLGLNVDHLAYVIYTSGSTGRPKGVMNEHRGLFNRLQWMQQQYGLNETDRVLQKTPFSFDVSVWEFFWPLQQGACLVMARPGGHRDPQYLIEQIQGAGITTVHFVPSMLQNFLEYPDVSECRSLRRVVCSGEELPLGTSRACLAKMPWTQLYNLYGPTEAAIDVTAWDCRRTDVSARVPIGRPIANTRIYILDTQGEPVPVGAVGEIYIGGVAVARGYLNRQELTRERFVHDPFRGHPRGRLYRSGDLGRWRADGDIEYLGRNDHQVKVRGYRIELGEIEAHLTQIADVSAAVVLAREDEPGHKRLVAYVVLQSCTGERAAQTELAAGRIERWRKNLQEHLPEYMVPAAFVLLERLPLTSNGKVDRRALPVPGPIRRCPSGAGI